MAHDPDSPCDHVTVPRSPEEHRNQTLAGGAVLNPVRPVHPDDIVTLPSGLRVTSVARALVDLAEDMTRDELRVTFELARRQGLLELDAVRASRGRVEWRPSLRMLDDVIEEFSQRR
jgi:hypothetical protein